MARVGYFDRAGLPITQAFWKEKQADPSYTTVRQYDNAVVKVTLKWNGRVTNTDTFQDYWPMFILLVQNYTSDGSLANDPVAGDKTFGSEEAALKGYEDFLVDWTGSERDTEGAFVEADNLLTPPPPPDPNQPASVSEELGDEGAW